ncbi:hypothetical protein A3F06_01285 [candidate division TM6 bacterium RIFCSPHIGHO2_12_FULL_36_22]|nr:MAG: hypothetical protein A3F06_01285 [candidate division TM6 bacterium RIFCSPHIGHO2_12_FULL_36_22]
MKKIIISTLFLSLVLFSAINTTGVRKKIYIVPPGGYENDRLFTLSNDWLNRDDVNKVWVDLKNALAKKGYHIQTVKMGQNISDGEALITCGILHAHLNTFMHYRNSGKKVIAMLFEPRTIEPHSYNKASYPYYTTVLTMYDEDVEKVSNCKKLHYPQPILTMREQKSFQEKKLCTMINSNKSSHHKGSLYPERIKAVKFFCNRHPNDFTFYGQGWDKNIWRCYGGGVKCKSDILINFKFSICYDNTSDAGYLTEKIFDCLEAGCVPIYLGCPNVTDYVPTECFIDMRKFSSYDELYDFVKNMSEEEHQKYLDAIQAFFASEKAHKFSSEYFVETVCKALDIE